MNWGGGSASNLPSESMSYTVNKPDGGKFAAVVVEVGNATKTLDGDEWDADRNIYRQVNDGGTTSGSWTWNRSWSDCVSEEASYRYLTTVGFQPRSDSELPNHFDHYAVNGTLMSLRPPRRSGTRRPQTVLKNLKGFEGRTIRDGLNGRRFAERSRIKNPVSDKPKFRKLT